MALFGTDGVRGVAGVDLTAELAFNLTTAAASVLADLGEFAGHRPTAIVGQDSRASGQYLEEAICRGLSSAGIDVYRVGILPTPAISFLVKDRGADLGVMISASHNPASDNGIKFFDRTGSKLADQIEAKIESVLGKTVESTNGAGAVIEDLDAKESYIQNLLESLDGNLSGLKVVVDCANGAASFVAPELLKRAGADVVAISASPNVLNKEGKNVHVEMGSYGIGVSRLVAAVIEAKCVEGVMKWPLVISPFDIAIIPLNNKSDTAPLDKARKIYETLKVNSIDVILDDTLESPSSKFKNFDLIGVPFQIIIGSKSSEDRFEFKELNAKTEMLTVDEIIKKIKKLKG